MTVGRVGVAAALALAVAACGSSAGGAADAGGGFADASVCEFPPGAVIGPMVRAVYLVPSDRAENPAYTAAIESAVRDVQLWFRDNTEGAITFPVHEPLVEVVRTSHPASYYADNATEGEPPWRFWNNVTADAFALTAGSTSAGTTSWLYFIDAEPGCDQVGAAGAGTAAVISKGDLRGLAGEPVLDCEGQALEPEPRCRWVGGVAFFTALATGVPGCTQGEAGCPDNHILSPNFRAYPDVALAAGDEAVLREGGLYRAVSLPRCAIDCSDVPEREALRPGGG